MRRAALLAMALALVTAGCAKSTPGGGGRATAPPPPPTGPLTGLRVDSSAIERRPALAVKIENSIASRPQAGLEKADVVYEELVEGGITRFMAIFQSRDALSLGPIRSAREVDPDILGDYGVPGFAFSGAAGFVFQKVKAAQTAGKLVMLTETIARPAYERLRTRRAPHNLYASTTGLYREMEGKGSAPPRAFAFGPALAPPAPASPAPGASATPAAWPSGKAVKISFSSQQTSKWAYDAATASYLRAQGTTRHMLASGVQVSAKNVLLVYVKVTQGTHRDAAGNYSPVIEVVGAGEAALLRDGVRIPGRWARPALGRPTAYTDAEGRGLTFAKGQTWIELVPIGTDVAYG